MRSLAAFADVGPWCGPETILLVEDEAFVREAYRSCLRPVDLLLTDVTMPGMSGRDLAAKFKSLCPRVRVLLMSGYAEQRAADEPSCYGKKCLAKPFSISTLLSGVREALDTNPFDWGAQAQPTLVLR
jgi:CheY-like chemotaxis protein